MQFDATGDCTWVKFEAVETWVGVFGSGILDASMVAANNDGDMIFVLAGGRGYIVSESTREGSHATESDYLTSVIAIPGRTTFVACTFTELIAYSDLGVVWRSPRVSVDGIRLLEASEKQMRGEVYDLSRWIPFSLSLPSSEYSCEWSY